MPTTETKRPELEPLQIRCTRSDCENGLHCFKKTRAMAPSQVGQCRSCGVKPIDWDRVRRHDVADASFTFEALKYEWVRHHFWHADIDDKAQAKAKRKGWDRLRVSADERLRASIGKAHQFRDGTQTPFDGNILYYAQHALACCCRSCLEYWHGIPKGTALADEDIEYLAQLVMLYVADRMPELVPATDGSDGSLNQWSTAERW